MSVKYSSPALTQHPPRSPRLRLGGYVLLPRILDKGRAALAGKLGEFHYGGKGMDRHFFNFTGLDHESFKAEIAKFSSTREDIRTWFDLLDLDDHCTFGGKA